MNNMSFSEYMDAMCRKEKKLRKETGYEMCGIITVEFVDVWGNVFDYEVFEDYFRYKFYDFYKYFAERFSYFCFDDFYDYNVENSKHSENVKKISFKVLVLRGVA